VDAVSASFRHSVYVASDAAGSAANLRPQASVSDELHGFHFAFRNRGETSLDNVDAELVQTLRYPQFVFRC
jgi:hypothetical protein